ncbi:hypothetical protein [Amycolatopsis vancoresmycina]|uniref:Uncharacterized protein n=1 Tax=Amycolatopsis vancoresmycina DSM 44592 TaxID=1292037 RepID=R1I862_9PSEU|nr:hypothetical protein [Amycolatopsis vancoresmycina]EOD66599.1 hypothetical protein H480_20714 [Amycolatopsis vancoresmycina DSM 44592]
MEDLFRFLLVRPASPTASNTVLKLVPRFVAATATRDVAQAAAVTFIGQNPPATATAGFVFANLARDVAAFVGDDSKALKDVVALVKSENSNHPPADVVKDSHFDTERKLLIDVLCALKLTSDSAGADAPALANLLRGYDAIQLAAAGTDPITLRVLQIVDFAPPPAQPVAAASEAEPAADTPPPDPAEKLAAVLSAIDALGRLPVTSFRQETKGGVVIPLQADEPAPEVSVSGQAAIVTPWQLSPEAVAQLPETTTRTAAELGLDLSTQALPVVVSQLHERRVQLQTALDDIEVAGTKARLAIGGSFVPSAGGGYVGDPHQPFPSGRGNVKPVGIGDLLLVKQHTLRYEGGELAHVENVLKTEKLSRSTRRLDRTETTIVQETESTSETERDNQTTERFSLQRETSDTISTESSFKAGVAVDAKYGPFVEVNANADFATSTATQSAAKQASDFGKDVVDRSVSKLSERVLERRSTTTIAEFEEQYSHAFDNTDGPGHVVGYYQWIDKVLQAQVYNYGKRLMFDITVPEPGTNFILSQIATANSADTLVEPPPFTIRADELTESNYTVWAKRYDATGLEPPPVPVKTIAKAYDASMSQDPHETTKSDTFTIDDGYRAKYALISAAWDVFPGGFWFINIGSNSLNILTENPYVTMADEVGSVAVSFEAGKMEELSANIEIFCYRTERAVAAWQQKVHATITQAFLAKQQAYEQALSQARAAAGTVISGRNPDFNQRLVANELRRQCVTMITGQQFDGFGALQLTPEGYAQPDLARTDKQMPYVRFFEQAFEWEHLVYFSYPYFWGWKPGWKNRMLLDDTDPTFADFLRAGAARVVFPVRPGFEAAVVHYLETGEIWNGGAPPDISGSLYLPIVTEIQEQTGAPQGEVAVGDPWLVHLPTTLVRLRPNNDLPAWKKVGDDWQPTN